jgi:hypothetical protein
MAYHEMPDKLEIPGPHETDTDVLELVREHLSQESAGLWLMTLENGDELGMWTSPLTSNPQSKRLLYDLPRSKFGSITRDRHVTSCVASGKIIKALEMDEE